MAKTPDPRIKRLERLLSQAMALLGDIRATPPPAAKRKRKPGRRYRRAPILAALREGARPTASASERDPRLPSYPTFQRLRRRDRNFDAKAREALQQSRPQRRRAAVAPQNRKPLHERFDLEVAARTIESGVRVAARNRERCGLPDAGVIREARRDYPWFEARVGPIIDARTKRRIYIDREATLAGLRAGAVISANPPAPGMPTMHQIKRARWDDSEFDAAVASALLEGRAARTHKARRERAGKLPGAGWDWDAVAREIENGATIGKKTKNRGSLPPEHVILQRQRLDPSFAAKVGPHLSSRRGNRDHGWGPQDHDTILERVREGARIDAHYTQPGMPSRRVLARMRRDEPTFNKAMVAASREAKRRAANRRALSNLGRDAPFRIAQAAVPAWLDPDSRDDIVQELILLLLGGLVAQDDNLSATWKQCRTRLNAGRWKEVSLDAPLNGYDGASRIDLLADDTPHF